MRPGYNTNGLAGHRLEEALELIRETGFQVAALTLDLPHLDPLGATPAAVAALARRLADLELEAVVETGGRFLLDPRRKHRPNLLEADPAERNRRLALLEESLRIAADLGAPVLSLWSGALPAGVTPQEARDRFIEGLSRLLARAEGTGVRIALEPEPGHLVERVEHWRELAGILPELGLCLDIGHLVANGEPGPAEVLRPEEVGRLLQVHLEDARPGVHEHLPPGQGVVDFPATLAALRGLGYAGPVCWELSRSSPEGPAALRRAWQCWQDSL